MKKVLVIAPYQYLPYFSGGQKLIAQFLHYLGKEVTLDVISVAANDISLIKTYTLKPLLKKSFARYFDTSLIKKITAEVEKNNYDNIIWEHPYFAWLAFKVRKKTGAKTFIHTHNIEHQRFRSLGKWWWRVLRMYEKWCFKKADGLFFITPEDKAFAMQQWKIAGEKCFDLPVGVELSGYPTDKATCRNSISEKHTIPSENRVILFNGLLRYKPNLDALKIILDTINPLLQNEKGFKYTILICGKDLPIEFNELKAYRDKNIIYAGFVDDIDTYFKGSDIFLNPVQSGGGIKTKMVEAIAYGTTVVATNAGAAGIDPSVCGQKLILVKDDDWNKFAKAITRESKPNEPTPIAYYEKYYWGNIIKRITTENMFSKITLNR